MPGTVLEPQNMEINCRQKMSALVPRDDESL